jgi:hypothetical protein
MRLNRINCSPLSWTTIVFAAFLSLLIGALLQIVGLGFCSNCSELDTDRILLKIGGLATVWRAALWGFTFFIGGIVGSMLLEAYGRQCAVISRVIIWGLAAFIVFAVFVLAIL